MDVIIYTESPIYFMAPVYHKGIQKSNGVGT